jgi:rhodanese-related sulfurtransferase
MARTVRGTTVEEPEAARDAGGVRMTDVRSPEEHGRGHVPGAVEVPALPVAGGTGARTGSGRGIEGGRGD